MSWTLKEALKKSLQVRWAGAKNEKKAVANAMRVLDILGRDTRLDDINASKVDALVEGLRRSGAGPATINRHLAALSALFSDALDRGGATTQPRIRRLREPAGRLRYLSAEEEAALIGAMQDQEAKDLTIVLLNTGCRVGELIGRELVVEDGHLRVWENKADRPRSIPLTAKAAAVLAVRRQFSLTYWQFRKRWDAARLAAGLGSDVVIHSCRHTFASRLVQRDVSLPVVSALLGHGSVTITQRYSHLANSQLAAAVASLEEA
jgi:hypothetical protein